MRRTALIDFALTAVCLAAGVAPLSAQTNSVAPVSAPLPELGFSVVRLFGALALVLALFLGGVWLFRNWQRLAWQRGRTPQLAVLEVKSLGARQGLYVVGYQQQRMLLAASPAGITLVSHLPDASAEEASVTRIPFTEALLQAATRK